MTVFGPIGHAGQLEKAVENQLREWMPTYLKEVGRQHSLKLGSVKSYSVVSQYATFPEQGLPAVVVESAGLIDEPEQDGEGWLKGPFSVEVTVAMQGPDAVSTRQLAQCYAAAVTGSLMQHRKLAQHIWVERFVDSAFAGANVEQRRTRIAVALVFRVVHEKFLNVREGPVAPDPEGLAPDLPTVESTEVDVEKD